MPPPIFLDTNVPIYAAGRPHPLKAPCAEILVLAAQQPHEFLTDAEVLQELLHRYLALRLWPQGKEAFARFAALMRERVEPVYASDVEQAASLVEQYPRLSARDLLHLAVMMRVGVNHIISADQGFDGVAQLERLDPASLRIWRGRMEME